MFAKVIARSHSRNFHKVESKFIDFSVDTFSQRIFIKTMPGLKLFLESGDFRHIFGSMRSSGALEIHSSLSTFPLFMTFSSSMQ